MWLFDRFNKPKVKNMKKNKNLELAVGGGGPEWQGKNKSKKT